MFIRSVYSWTGGRKENGCKPASPVAGLAQQVIVDFRVKLRATMLVLLIAF